VALRRHRRAGHGLQQAPAEEGLRAEPAALQGRAGLLARDNFGCGSSREHAPWAIEDYGFRVVIAPSFADIFFGNSYKNGILPIVASHAIVDRCSANAKRQKGYRLRVDLETQTVRNARRRVSFKFDITPHRKHCLLNGLDEIGLTLQHADEIKAFEAKHKAAQPWLFSSIRPRSGLSVPPSVVPVAHRGEPAAAAQW
jgi:3-isopropylmalate/(R)-2-methylmalate dehydratase small subunit